MTDLDPNRPRSFHPLYENEGPVPEDLRSFRPDAFPNRIAYPSPDSPDFPAEVSTQSMYKGRLETRWQPVWSTVNVPWLACDQMFFDGRVYAPYPQSSTFANGFTYPNDMFVWEIGFTTERPLCLFEDFVIFQVGSKIRVSFPLSAAHRRAHSTFFPLPLPIQIETCRSFDLRLILGHVQVRGERPEPIPFRVSLNGYVRYPLV